VAEGCYHLTSTGEGHEDRRQRADGQECHVDVRLRGDSRFRAQGVPVSDTQELGLLHEAMKELRILRTLWILRADCRDKARDNAWLRAQRIK